jgi:acetolactate synthase-1/3 small subunit
MTIVVNVDAVPLDQVRKQLDKLVNVLKIVELDPSASVQRELLLVKVHADETNRRDVLSVVELFKAKVADVGPEAVTIELSGRPDKLEAMLKMLEPYGIREVVQSGMVALGRGPRSMTQAALRSVERSA